MLESICYRELLYLCLFSACSDLKLHFSLHRIKHCCLNLLFCHSLCCLLSCAFTVISCAMKRAGRLQKQLHRRAASGCWAQEHPMHQGRETAHLWVPVLGWGRECYCWAAARRKNKLACGRQSWYKSPSWKSAQGNGFPQIVSTAFALPKNCPCMLESPKTEPISENFQASDISTLTCL